MKRTKNLRNDYVFGSVLGGTAKVSDKEDHVEMQDSTENLRDEIRQVTDNILIGKYCSQKDYLLRWFPGG